MARGKSATQLDKLITEALAIEAESARDAGALGFMARAMVQATMPHRRVAGNEFVRRNGAFELSLMAPASVGLPYGTIPRLLLAWITTEAVKTKSRELELGDSLSAFMRELDLVPTGGRWGTITRLKSQTLRLFSSTVSVTYSDTDRTALAGWRLTDRANLWWHPKAPDQSALWKSTVRLTEEFYQEVVTRPVPLDMRALKALKRSPLAIDLYIWMSYRASYLQKEARIPWVALAAQFGSDYARTRDFKAAFLGELRKVQTIYPQARLQVTEAGLVLLPSPPHIPLK